MEIKLHPLTSDNLNYAPPPLDLSDFLFSFSFLPVPHLPARLEIESKQEAELHEC